MPQSPRRSSEPGHQRKFLIIVDGTAESDRAIYYAARRAQSTGGQVVMLAISEPPDRQSWVGVEALMRQEALDAAQEALQQAAIRVRAVSGLEPERHVGEGDKAAEILRLISEDEDIAILILAAGTGREGPGPLIAALAGGAISSFSVPITIVPGHLSDAEIDALS